MPKNTKDGKISSTINPSISRECVRTKSNMVVLPCSRQRAPATWRDGGEMPNDEGEPWFAFRGQAAWPTPGTRFYLLHRVISGSGLVGADGFEPPTYAL
jgi:hypothetical protein